MIITIRNIKIKGQTKVEVEDSMLFLPQKTYTLGLAITGFG